MRFCVIILKGDYLKYKSQFLIWFLYKKTRKGPRCNNRNDLANHSFILKVSVVSDVFRTQSNIYDRDFPNIAENRQLILQKSSIMDARLRSKYGSDFTNTYRTLKTTLIPNFGVCTAIML